MTIERLTEMIGRVKEPFVVPDLLVDHLAVVLEDPDDLLERF